MAIYVLYIYIKRKIDMVIMTETRFITNTKRQGDK